MEPIVLIAGSAVGALTAVGIGRFSRSKLSPVSDHPSSMGNSRSYPLDLQRRIVTEAMNRVYEYEQQGRITKEEREHLVVKYREELSNLEKRVYSFSGNNIRELNAFKENLIAAVDQRMAHISMKMDELVSRLASASVSTNNASSSTSSSYARSRVALGRKESPKRQDHIVTTTPAAEPVSDIDVGEQEMADENDPSLDEIKKQIMQTLSKLEQAEVD